MRRHLPRLRSQGLSLPALALLPALLLPACTMPGGDADPRQGNDGWPGIVPVEDGRPMLTHDGEESVSFESKFDRD
ncbi:MAG: hypothetical protein ACPGQD_03755 [Planctomycetota bacterium]